MEIGGFISKEEIAGHTTSDYDDRHTSSQSGILLAFKCEPDRSDNQFAFNLKFPFPVTLIRQPHVTLIDFSHFTDNI